MISTKHPLYTALILELFFLPWAMFCVYDTNTSVFILGTNFWSAAALYCRNKLENLLRTDRQINRQTNKQTDKQTENSKTEATLSPVVCGSSGNAGQLLILLHPLMLISLSYYRHSKSTKLVLEKLKPPHYCYWYYHF